MALPSWYVFPKELSSRTRLKIGIFFLIVFAVLMWVSHSSARRVPAVAPSSASSKIFSSLPTRTISLGNKTYTVEVADTPTIREEGLSDRPSMAPDHGMLFLFEQPVRTSFWMPRMHFPLDIIFLRNGVVVDLVKNLPFPQGNEAPAIYAPKADYDSALEVNAGVADQQGITIGQKLL